jgi:hypothetical protein
MNARRVHPSGGLVREPYLQGVGTGPVWSNDPMPRNWEVRRPTDMVGVVPTELSVAGTALADSA